MKAGGKVSSSSRPGSSITWLPAFLLLLAVPALASAEAVTVDPLEVGLEAVDTMPETAEVVIEATPEALLEELEEEKFVSAQPPVVGEKPGRPWSVSVNAATSSSMAMFHPTEYVRSYGRSLSMSVGGSGSYRLTDDLSASLGLGAAYHLVNPKDLSGRRFWLSDPSLGVSHRSLYRDDAFTGVNLSGGISATAGLSPASRYWNRVGSLAGVLSAGRGFLDGRLNAGWSLSLGLSFSRYTSPVVARLSDDGLDMALARAAGGELLAGQYNLVSGNAQLGSLGNTISLSFRAVEGLTASISFGVSHDYRYCPPIDDLSSEVVDHTGERIVRQGGVCRGDGMIGSFGVTYDLGGGYNLAAGFSSAQPAFAYRGTSLTEESRTLRFPWWDPDLHMTSFSLRASKSF